MERLLILLALYKLRALTDGGMRLRTACDLSVISEQSRPPNPRDGPCPQLNALEEDLKAAIATCKGQMTVETVEFNDELKKGKEQNEAESGAANNGGDE